LSERLSIPVNELLNRLSSAEIAEYMAFDLLKDKDSYDRIKMDTLSEEEKMNLQKKLMGF
jgi:hypothetical protein